MSIKNPALKFRKVQIEIPSNNFHDIHILGIFCVLTEKDF